MHCFRFTKTKPKKNEMKTENLWNEKENACGNIRDLTTKKKKKRWKE